MGKAFGLAALAIGGVIVADFVIHPAGTKAVAAGATSIATPTFGALLGKSTA
jgi:uncharacterized membrane protein